ncbi:hypothetical protein MBLNU459_g2509t1 [Dothideomycetes sp. NU459]
MGSRLSMPKGPAGTTEMSHPSTSPYRPGRARSAINSRTIVAPAAAFTMACLLFVYTRTSIRAAKANAQRHRDSDSGGEGLDLLKESRRRHGMADKIDDTKGGVLGEIAVGAREHFLGTGSTQSKRTKEAQKAEAKGEDKLKAAMNKRSARDQHAE